jgi:hypothetical protein
MSFYLVYNPTNITGGHRQAGRPPACCQHLLKSSATRQTSLTCLEKRQVRAWLHLQTARQKIHETFEMGLKVTDQFSQISRQHFLTISSRLMYSHHKKGQAEIVYPKHSRKQRIHGICV